MIPVMLHPYRYTGTDGDKSNMAVVDVKMMTGFAPDKVTLKALHDPAVGPENFRKYEIDGKSISFYFDEVSFIRGYTGLFHLNFAHPL